MVHVPQHAWVMGNNDHRLPACLRLLEGLFQNTLPVGIQIRVGCIENQKVRRPVQCSGKSDQLPLPY